MVSFDEVMGDIQQVTNVTATMIPGGQYFIGSHATQNQQATIGSLGSGIGSIFGGATGAASGLLSTITSNPMVWVGGAVALLILIK